MKQAVDLALENVRTGAGGPFGAVVVKDGEVVATGVNQVTSTNDPSAHAEVVAIRAACQSLATFELQDCEIYCSCEPCPMCLGAIYWARAKAIYFACNRRDAAKAGFDDAFIYDEVGLLPESRSIPGFELCPETGHLPFEEWIRLETRKDY
jgi:guanine deaminase